VNQLSCDPLDALNEALCHEEEGHSFYLSAAERTEDPKGKAMFRSLAEDAQMQIEIIQRQMDAFQEGSAWALPECVFDCEADLEQPLYPRGQKAIDQAVHPDDSDLDALIFALKTENDSFDLFALHASAATDPQAKSLYEYLTEQARTHFNLLMLSYEGLSSKTGWVD